MPTLAPTNLRKSRRLIVIPEVYDGIVSSLDDVPEVHFYARL